jgi:3-oxoacyl-[acyl-carrier-protein] synthase III
MPVYIAGGGYHHPERRITNDDLGRLVDTSDEWIRRHTGIVERRQAADDVNTSDLGIIATRLAIENVGWEPSDIEVLICATSTPDSLTPATASYIAGALGLDSIAFDLNASCSGFVYGIAVADGLMRVQGHERIALCTAEKYTRVTNYDDRNTCIFFGDSAATAMLQSERPERGAEILDVQMMNINRGADLVGTPVGGYLAMDGPSVKSVALPALADSATAMLDKHSLTVSDLRAFMGHQVNYRLLETLTDQLGVADHQHWHNVTVCGNQGAAGVITTFLAGIEEHEEDLRDGDLFLLAVVGAGFTAGSALLRWIDASG